jgi:hypothetical protein
MRACVRREWRLGDDRGATADAVELAEWTINYIAADPALPLLIGQTQRARASRNSNRRGVWGCRPMSTNAEDFRASFERARGSAVDGGSVLTNTTTAPGQLLVKISRH